MLNQVVVVGRLVKDPELRKSEKDKNYTNITLAVPRSYKNLKGEYEADFIDCRLWTGIAESTTEYCKKGDLLGVRGRIETSSYDDENGEMKKSTVVIAEKITYLTNKKED